MEAYVIGHSTTSILSYRHRLLHLRDQGKFPLVLVASIDGFKCIKRLKNNIRFLQIFQEFQ